MNQGKWVRSNKNGLNVVFIHGINSSEDCWKNKNGSYWPQLLEDESELANIGVYVFSYRTGLNTGFYSLSDIVDSLREYFVLDNLIDSTGVIFVCHSMGGIIARRFLVNQYSTLIEIGLKKIGLFLVASPSLGSEYANMLSLVSIVVGHTQASALKFSQNNVWLNDLDKDFINLMANENLRIRGKELIEDLPLYGKGFLKKQIVEPFSGAKYFGNSFKVPGSDHSTIATPTDSSAVQHRLLVQFIKEFVEEEFRLSSVTVTGTECQIVDELLTFLEDRRLITEEAGYQSHFPDPLRKSAQEIRHRTNDALQKVGRESPLTPILKRIQKGARDFQEMTEGAADGSRMGGGTSPHVPMGLSPYLRALEKYRQEIAEGMIEAADLCGLKLDPSVLAAFKEGQETLRSIAHSFGR